jgi:hypothetical protein
MLFQASSPTDEISGASIQAYVHALGLSQRRGLQVLAEHGISNVSPDAWYSWQAYLNAQRAIYEDVGPNTVGRIGRMLVEESSFPPEIDTVHAALASLNDDYLLRHRGRDVGGFLYTPKDERSGRMIIRNPYPCQLDWQVVEALCRRFRPKNSLAVYLSHDGECRNDGAEQCEIDVRW